MASTIDVLSGGRIELGVGTGWQREEFEAAGIDFARRGQLLTDTIGGRPTGRFPRVGSLRSKWPPSAAPAGSWA